MPPPNLRTATPTPHPNLHTATLTNRSGARLTLFAPPRVTGLPCPALPCRAVASDGPPVTPADCTVVLPAPPASVPPRSRLCFVWPAPTWPAALSLCLHSPCALSLVPCDTPAPYHTARTPMLHARSAAYAHLAAALQLVTSLASAASPIEDATLSCVWATARVANTSWYMCTYPAQLDKYVSGPIQRSGCWLECEDVLWMQTVLRRFPNSQLLDVGGNIGFYTLAAAAVRSQLKLNWPHAELPPRLQPSVGVGCPGARRPSV